MTNKQIFGFIVPINVSMLKNLTKKKNAILFKFMAHQALPSNLKNDAKILFYLSNSGRKVVGEANIEKLKLMKSSELINKYKKNLVVKGQELQKYLRYRKEKLAVVFFIKDIELYKTPFQLSCNLTMNGKYINIKEYGDLKNNPVK